mmetsp:Transcript_233/g.1831  ORF Transcript_233/g.1831 Transcript_233/m.1831 type:complete len:157 (-) Transcript_233:1152-1622(-)
MHASTLRPTGVATHEVGEKIAPETKDVDGWAMINPASFQRGWNHLGLATSMSSIGIRKSGAANAQAKETTFPEVQARKLAKGDSFFPGVTSNHQVDIPHCNGECELIIPSRISGCRVLYLADSPKDGSLGARRELDSFCIQQEVVPTCPIRSSLSR